MERIGGKYILLVLFVPSLTLSTNFCYSQVNVTTNEQVGKHKELAGTSWWHKSNKTSTHLLSNGRRRSDITNQEHNYYKTEATANMKLLSTQMRALAPAFMLSSENISELGCKNENDIYMINLQKSKLWALQMYDSSAKITSGILEGNVNQLGDFDECVNVEDKKSNIRGKYCLAHFQVKVKDGLIASEEIKEILDRVQSRHILKSTMDDPGHRVPRFSSINWAVCVPSSCSHEEVQSQLQNIIKRHTNGSIIDFEVRVDKEMCYMKTRDGFSSSFKLISLSFGLLLALIATATIKDTVFGGDTHSFLMRFLDCFSLKRNIKQLVNIDMGEDDINSIHGVRMLNAIMLMVCHKSMAMFFLPYTNRTRMAEQVSQPWSIVGRTASLYTDTFIMISGILTAYTFSKTIRRNGVLNIKTEYINRLTRIFPLLIVTILLSTFIIPEIGSGPQWGSTVQTHSDYCRSTWWMNLLFVHNYFGFENMCLTHTHHLGIDTQLFFLSPFMILILHKWKLVGVSVLMALAAISTALRYHMTLSKDLSYFLYQGIPVKQMMDTANFSYIIPSHRLTVYVMGIITGYILQYCGKDYKIKSHIKRLWWTISFSLLYYIITTAVSMTHPNFTYNKYQAATYAALMPIAWCLFWSWIITASHTNNGGILGRIISSRYYAIWTRISYAVYLIQFPIFFFNVGSQRYPQEYTFFSLISVLEYLSIFIAAAILTLVFDLPVNNIRKLLRGAWASKCDEK